MMCWIKDPRRSEEKKIVVESKVERLRGGGRREAALRRRVDIDIKVGLNRPFARRQGKSENSSSKTRQQAVKDASNAGKG